MQSSEDSEFLEFYNKYTNVNKNLLRSVGLWPQDEGRKDSLRRRGLTIFYILLLLVLTVTQFYHVYLIWGNFFDCLEILCNTTTSLLIVHKAVTFFFKRDIIVDFEEQGRKMWILEFKEPCNRKMMIEAARTGQKLTYTFLGIVIFTVANFFLAPAISILHQWKLGIPPTEFSYVLPYLVKLPLDLRLPLQHAIAYIPTTICSISLVSYISGIDAFYFIAIQHLILQLKLLNRSLTDTKWSDTNNKKESLTTLLRSCVNKHRAIIKHGEVLEQIYGPIILGLGVISTLSMCMVIFHAVVTKGGHSGNIALFLMYFSMEVSEVLLYCWFGNALTFAVRIFKFGYTFLRVEEYDSMPGRKIKTPGFNVLYPSGTSCNRLQRLTYNSRYFSDPFQNYYGNGLDFSAKMIHGCSKGIQNKLENVSYPNALVFFLRRLWITSSEVCSALYHTDWYNVRCDRKAFASCICIMMIRSHRPIKLTAYKFVDVSLKLFTSIMSSTASYFALLRTLYTN